MSKIVTTYENYRAHKLALYEQEVEKVRQKIIDLFKEWAQFSESQEPRIDWQEVRNLREELDKIEDFFSYRMKVFDGKIPENPLPDALHTRY